MKKLAILLLFCASGLASAADYRPSGAEMAYRVIHSSTGYALETARNIVGATYAVADASCLAFSDRYDKAKVFLTVERPGRTTATSTDDITVSIWHAPNAPLYLAPVVQSATPFAAITVNDSIFLDTGQSLSFANLNATFNGDPVFTVVDDIDLYGGDPFFLAVTAGANIGDATITVGVIGFKTGQ